MVSRRSLRALSYMLVAVFAFGLGAARPAAAETGGIPQQLQALAFGLAAEVARAIGVETKLNAALAAQQLWNDRQAALEAQHARNEDAALADLGSLNVFKNAAQDIKIDAALLAAKIERERAAAAEADLRAEALLAAAKAAEAQAAALEKAVVDVRGYTDLRFAGALALGCVTADKRPGHLVATVGADNVVTLACVPNGQ